jgi:hypothetical protein
MASPRSDGSLQSRNPLHGLGRRQAVYHKECSAGNPSTGGSDQPRKRSVGEGRHGGPCEISDAARISPSDPRILQNIGIVYLRGKAGTGDGLLGRAMASNCRTPLSHVGMAEALVKMDWAEKRRTTAQAIGSSRRHGIALPFAPCWSVLGGRRKRSPSYGTPGIRAIRRFGGHGRRRPGLEAGGSHICRQEPTDGSRANPQWRRFHRSSSPQQEGRQRAQGMPA